MVMANSRSRSRTNGAAGLGSYQLDAVLDAAAARGIPNLHAHILVADRGMLALVR
jgi:hypothetical protein